MDLPPLTDVRDAALRRDHVKEGTVHHFSLISNCVGLHDTPQRTKNRTFLFFQNELQTDRIAYVTQ